MPPLRTLEAYLELVTAVERAAKELALPVQIEGYEPPRDPRLGWFKLRHKTESRYQLWQEGSHPQQIASEEMMIQKLEYMHNNPVRRGYVDAPEHWRYSSARNYLGLRGLIDVTTNWR